LGSLICRSEKGREKEREREREEEEKDGVFKTEFLRKYYCRRNRIFTTLIDRLII